MKVKSALILTWKCTKSVWRPGSARTHWGTYNTPETPYLDLMGNGRVKRSGEAKRQEGLGQMGKRWQGKERTEGRGREGRQGEEGQEGEKRKGKEGNLAPTVISKSRRLCCTSLLLFAIDESPCRQHEQADKCRCSWWRSYDSASLGHHRRFYDNG